MLRSILDIKGLRSTDQAFQRGLVELSDRLGLDAGYLAAVIAVESRFDPSARNPKSHATGLIQFLPSTAKLYGTSVDELRQMTAVEQLPYIEKHYASIGLRPVSLEDHYLAVFAPACVGADLEALLPCRASSSPWSAPPGGCTSAMKSAYCLNAALDRNGDGFISVYEAAWPARALVEDARTRPPLTVDMQPFPPAQVELARSTNKLLPVLIGSALGAGGVWIVRHLATRAAR